MKTVVNVKFLQHPYDGYPVTLVTVAMETGCWIVAAL